MSKQTQYDKIKLLGVEVDAVSNTDAIAYICDYAADPKRPAAYVIKPYVEFLDHSYRHPNLRQLLAEAELSIADGVALLWAAHFLYAGPRSFGRFWLTLFQIILAPSKLRWPLPDRAAGTTFTWPLIKAAAQQHLSLYLIGDPQGGSLANTVHHITKHVPQATIVGTRSGRDSSRPRGQVSEEWLAATATTIKAANPDIVLVGMGFPLQEKVCAYLCTQLDHGICIGEGGTFDYESFGGIRPKAPTRISQLGLEWLWRLTQEPRRIKRQLAIPRFIFRIWKNR